MKRLFLKLGLICAMLVSLSACNGETTGNTTTTTTDNNPIQWDRSATTVVFRAEVRGGEYENTFLSRNEISPCTIYGDNRVVWTVENTGSANQVLIDQITDERLRQFVEYLVVVEQFYTYEAGADLVPPSDVSPVVETLTLNVNDVEKRTDAFGGWDVNYYQRILEVCRAISAAPSIFEPDGAWVTAQAVNPDSDASLINWDGDAAGLLFADLAANSERRWITGQIVRILWNLLRNAPFDVRFREGVTEYQVALEVPGITRNAPAAP